MGVKCSSSCTCFAAAGLLCKSKVVRSEQAGTLQPASSAGLHTLLGSVTRRGGDEGSLCLAEVWIVH